MRLWWARSNDAAPGDSVDCDTGGGKVRVGLKIKIVNHTLYQAILNTGCKTVAEFCRKFGFHQTLIGEFLNLKSYPKNNEYCKRLEDALGEPLRLLFPEELKIELGKKKITKNNYYINGEMSLERLEDMNSKYLISDDYSMKSSEEETKYLLNEALDTLTKRQRTVLKHRFGLGGGEEKTLEEVGKIMKTNKERIRQIEAVALRKLRHPARLRKLRESRR